MTSKWVHQLVELGEVIVSDWRVLVLELVNGGEETLEASAGYRAAPALRTAVAIRAAHDGLAVGRFYRSLDTRTWDSTEDVKDPDTIRAALRDAGLDDAIYDAAMADPATWDAVVAEHHEIVDGAGGFGVPTIQLDAGEGPGIFGPVISKVPADDEAVELWRHVAWLTRSDNFWEVKRARAVPPDLEGLRIRRAEQEAADAAANAEAPKA